MGIVSNLPLGLLIPVGRGERVEDDDRPKEIHLMRVRKRGRALAADGE